MEEVREEKQAMLFDTHAHYNDEKFQNDREELLSNLPGLGVGRIVNACAKWEEIPDILALTEKYDFLFGMVGVHPDEVGELTESHMDALKKYSQNPKIRAIGEIGLDYYWDKENHSLQKQWFLRQMEVAREVGLPIAVHSRDAAEDTLEVMKSAKAEEIGGILHCFSYGTDMAKKWLSMGFYLGVGGVLTFTNGRKLKEVVEYAPLDRLVLETDCPYLAPVPHRGERNYSGYLSYVAEEMARIKGITPEEVKRITWENGCRVYGWKENEWNIYQTRR